ncbi:MAG: Fe-S protein assembly co-chaperone HscB [Betaproteobacteria bacterium]
MLDFTRNHFELFGLPVRYALDESALDDAYRALQRTVHPDRHAGSDDAAKRMALQAAARVNEAHRTLADPVDRARYLLSLRGVDAFDETDTALDVDFLERQLDRRERAAEAAEAGDTGALEALLDEVRRESASAQTALGSMLDAPTPSSESRGRVRELRFLDKLAGDVDEMIDGATSSPAWR